MARIVVTMPKKSAFTLLELAITVTIVALLAGGVLAGQTLMRSAELRSILKQRDMLVTSSNSFKLQYRYLPGDLPNATQYWRSLFGNGTNITCRKTAATDARTCNGDGDGIVRNVTTTGPETLRYFQHLANAGYIQGQYTGAYDNAGDPTAEKGQSAKNALRGKIQDTLWASFHFIPDPTNPKFFQGEYGNSLYIGGYIPNDQPEKGFLLPIELYELDTKTDDGKPATGKMVAYGNGPLTNCTNTADNSNMAAEYDVNSTTLACLPFFRMLY